MSNEGACGVPWWMDKLGFMDSYILFIYIENIKTTYELVGFHGPPSRPESRYFIFR